MNLYEETVEALDKRGYGKKDVAWVGSETVLLDTASFWERARVTDYDRGFGAQEIAEDLVIVMLDGSYYTRGEYDGSEWWEWHPCTLRKPDGLAYECTALSTTDVGLVGWESLLLIMGKAAVREESDFWANGEAYD